MDTIRAGNIGGMEISSGGVVAAAISVAIAIVVEEAAAAEVEEAVAMGGVAAVGTAVGVVE